MQNSAIGNPANLQVAKLTSALLSVILVSDIVQVVQPSAGRLCILAVHFHDGWIRPNN